MIKHPFLFMFLLLGAVALALPVFARGSSNSNSQSLGLSSTSSAGPAGITWNDSSPRNVDDRQLNAFGGELAQIDPKSAGARAKLDDLAGRVEKYHQALFTRKYNAMDILKDTEDLQKRIEAKRAEAPAAPVATPPAGAPTPVTPAP
jgi:hypothetical protein